jgi:hypothetical protein
MVMLGACGVAIDVYVIMTYYPPLNGSSAPTPAPA